jgi:molybdopterin converting factor small subunit
MPGLFLLIAKGTLLKIRRVRCPDYLYTFGIGGYMKLKSLQADKIEIRGFLKLDAKLRKYFGTKPPYFMALEKAITGLELSHLLLIERDDIEVIFVNGFVQSVDYLISPGDRIAFLPPGCPGPYRVALGFYNKNQDKKADV